MSFTRFHDDDVRIETQLEKMTYAGRYQLNVPGQGVNMPFQEDAQIRLQHWGANLRTHSTHLESDLMGLTRNLQRDDVEQNSYTKHEVSSQQKSYPNVRPFIDETRATHPAWMYRDAVRPRWEEPFINPQANLEKPFHDNIQTRVLEKDYYKPTVSVSLGMNDADPTTIEYYLRGR
jgi:hypothetical protein